MTVTKAGKARKQKKQRLSEAQIFALADQYEGHASQESTAKQAKDRIKRTLIEQIHSLRKLAGMESGAYGRFTRITVVENETVQYDETGLWRDLTPAQRTIAFDRLINLNALSATRRRAIVATITSEELAEITERRLNVEKLSQAVQGNKIDGKIVSENAEIVKSAPYIRISHGSGE